MNPEIDKLASGGENDRALARAFLSVLVRTYRKYNLHDHWSYRENAETLISDRLTEENIKSLQLGLRSTFSLLDRSATLSQTLFSDGDLMASKSLLTGALHDKTVPRVRNAIAHVQEALSQWIEIEDRFLEEIESEKPASPKENDDALSPWREQALLSSLTEKFYDSKAFKVTIGVLVLTVIFALSGNIYILNQSFNLRKELNDTAASTSTALWQKAKDAKDDIDKTTSEMKFALSAQQKSLETTSGAVEQKQNVLFQKFEDADRKIKTELGNFNNVANDLKSKIDKQASDIIKEEFQKQDSYLKQQIASMKADVGGDILQQRQSAIEQIDKRIGSIDKNLNDTEAAEKNLSRKTKAMNDNVTTYESDLRQLSGLAQGLASLRDAVSESDASSSKARKAAQDAASQSALAAQSVHELGSARETINTLVSDAWRDAGSNQQKIGEARSRILSVVDGISAAERELDALKRALKERLALQFDAAAQESARDKDRINPSASIESSIDRDTWKKVQAQLRKSGFKLKTIDGRKGAQTKRAIEGFQARRGDPRTGELTDVQLSALIKDAPDPSHQPKNH